MREHASATGRSTQFNPLGSLTLGIGGPNATGKAASDQNPVQQRVIVDDENMFDRCRENGELASAHRLSQCSCYRADLVVAHDAFVTTKWVTAFIWRTEFDPSKRLPAWQRRTVHDENVLTEVRR